MVIHSDSIAQYKDSWFENKTVSMDQAAVLFCGAHIR